MRTEKGLSRESEKLIVPVMGLLGPFLLLYFAAFQAFAYDNFAAAAPLVFVGIASAFTQRVHRAGYSSLRFFSILLVLGVTGTAYFRGGIVVGVLGWMLFPPVVFLLAFQFNEAGVWTVICAGAIGLLFGLEYFGLTPPHVASTSTGILGGTIAACVGLTVIVFTQALSRQREGRQRDLMERRLFRANKLESIARLAGGVAHDFNNLLTVITNHAQVLAEQGTNPDVEAIQQAAHAGTALTRRLLAIGRERDESKEHNPIDLNGVGAKVSALLQTLMPAGVRLTFEGAPGPAVTRADPWDIHQVLMNLVINARDAMPSGGAIDLSISFETPDVDTPLRFGVLNPGAYVVVRVKDSGVGMSDIMMNKVVEPFFTTRGRKGGTGLGLSIVYGVTRAQGGHLNIESVLDEGTTFSIYLPYADEVPMTPTEQEVTSSFPAAPSHILLVDDDPAVRRAISRLIGLEGHEVLTADGASDAREKFRDSHVNVLVTDINMPDGSGVDLAKELLRDSPDLGIVFVTGSSEARTPVGTSNVRYLTKPASRVELRRAVKAVASKKSIRPPLN